MTIRKTIYLKLALLVFAAVALYFVLSKTAESSIGLETSDTIEITPQQIKSIRDIGQWEFLTVSDEELVDTMRRGVFSNDRLARIYYGTMRIGIDLNKVNEGWIEARRDTIMLTLPPVGLLDERFIDEARTVSFYESGRWHAKDREAMYHRAGHRMLSRGLTPQNLRTAEDHADAQFRQLLRSMGFQNIVIRFAKE